MNVVAAEPAAGGVIGDIAKVVRKGQFILFLGSAVHAGPPESSRYSYPEQERPPLGDALAAMLAKESGFAESFPKESPTNLQRVSMHYEITNGRRKLVDRLNREVDVNKRPSPVVRALAQLNFPIVLTTNYDRLFEKALRDTRLADREDERKDPRIIIYSKDAEKQTPAIREIPPPEKPLVVKLHGDVEHLNDIVITDEDYIHFIMRMRDNDPWHPVPMWVRSQLQVWPTLFVGYRFMDYNLRLLFKTLRAGFDETDIPDTYSVDLDPDPLVLAMWQDKWGLVRYIVQNVWEFVPALYREVTDQEMPP